MPALELGANAAPPSIGWNLDAARPALPSSFGPARLDDQDLSSRCSSRIPPDLGRGGLVLLVPVGRVTVSGWGQRTRQAAPGPGTPDAAAQALEGQRLAAAQPRRRRRAPRDRDALTPEGRACPPAQAVRPRRADRWLHGRRTDPLTRVARQADLAHAASRCPFPSHPAEPDHQVPMPPRRSCSLPPTPPPPAAAKVSRRPTTASSLADAGHPREGGNGGRANPSSCSAAGYSACFIGAMKPLPHAERRRCRRTPRSAPTWASAPIPTGFGIQVDAHQPARLAG